MMGATFSVASTGMVRTPDGNAVASSPSCVGTRARAAGVEGDDLEVRITGLFPACPTRRRRRATAGSTTHEAPSAVTRSGTAWCRQPIIRSGSSWPTTWRTDTGVGPRRVQDAPLGDLHPERRQRRPVVRDLRRHHALQSEARIGSAIRRRHIDPPRRQARRAGEIHLDPVGQNRHRRRQPHRLLIPVGEDLGLEGAARNARDLRQRRPMASCRR